MELTPEQRETLANDGDIETGHHDLDMLGVEAEIEGDLETAAHLGSLAAEASERAGKRGRAAAEAYLCGADGPAVTAPDEAIRAVADYARALGKDELASHVLELRFEDPPAERLEAL